MPPSKKEETNKHRCTACWSTIKTSYDAKLHPLLKVLVCRKCYGEYGTGDFSLFDDPEIGSGVDENGDDNYCRWCVDGGDLFACANNDKEGSDKCHYAFCTDCIKRNCPNEEVLEQENFPPEKEYRWVCFACDSEKLKKHRQAAQEVILALSTRDLKRPPINNNVTSSSTAVTTNGNRIDKQTGSETSREKPKSILRHKDTDKEKEIEVPKTRDRQDTSERQRVKEMEARDKLAKEKETKEKEAKEAKDREAREVNAKEVNAKEVNAKESREKDQQTAKARDQQPQSGKEKEKSNERDKKSNRESVSTETGDGQVQKRRKTDNSSSELAVPKEPEASAMPQVAPPKPAETTLRRLSKKVNTPNTNRNFARPDMPSSAPPRQTQPNAQSRFPSSVNNINRVRPTSSASSLNQIQEVNKMNTLGMKSKSLSKQLKPTNEQIKPSCKVALTEIELQKRLDFFRSLNKNLVNEIGSKFENVFEMFLSKNLGENHSILKFEIEDMKKPVQDMMTMLRDLESLYHSQI